LRETLAALFVLGLVALVALPLAGGFRSRTDEAATRRTLDEVRDAVARYWRDAAGTLPRPHSGDRARKGHPQLVFLFVNPATWSREAARYTPQYTFDPERNIGWRGPYLTQPRGEYRIDESKRFSNMYGETGDQAVLDAWGRPLVLQYAARSEEGLLDLRVVSAGANGRLEIDPVAASAELDPTAVGDDLYVALALRE
jgi:hypothetical protein